MLNRRISTNPLPSPRDSPAHLIRRPRHLETIRLPSRGHKRKMALSKSRSPCIQTWVCKSKLYRIISSESSTQIKRPMSPNRTSSRVPRAATIRQLPSRCYLHTIISLNRSISRKVNFQITYRKTADRNYKQPLKMKIRMSIFRIRRTDSPLKKTARRPSAKSRRSLTPC